MLMQHQVCNLPYYNAAVVICKPLLKTNATEKHTLTKKNNSKTNPILLLVIGVGSNKIINLWTVQEKVANNWQWQRAFAGMLFADETKVSIHWDCYNTISLTIYNNIKVIKK